MDRTPVEGVIVLVFDGVSSFSEGLARIFVEDKVGFIDTQGKKNFIAVSVSFYLWQFWFLLQLYIIQRFC